jgi:hypothetical protein
MAVCFGFTKAGSIWSKTMQDKRTKGAPEHEKGLGRRERAPECLNSSESSRYTCRKMELRRVISQRPIDNFERRQREMREEGPGYL